VLLAGWTIPSVGHGYGAGHTSWIVPQFPGNVTDVKLLLERKYETSVCSLVALLLVLQRTLRHHQHYRPNEYH